MGNFKTAIKNFRKEQEDVYKRAPIRIKRDATSARKSIKDHVGRWLFELIQNCDDSEATTVFIQITDKCLYVADNGIGFKPHAVKSISGTDYSDKPAGSIGRKGVGFKSVYQITNNPKIFSLNSEGLEFDVTLCKNWFNETGISTEVDHIPYEWIPFFISRDSEENRDPNLKLLQNHNTVIVLPFKDEAIRKKAITLIKDWPPQSLFSLNHLKKIKVKGEEFEFEISLKKNNNSWILKDSRVVSISSDWKVLKEIISPPKDVLQELDSEDRKHVKNISFIIAAPLGEDHLVNPTNDFLNLHVFYPTEIPSPLRLFMHGEFLVKNDRTAIIPIDQSTFNTWIADKLAELTIEFVNNSYNSKHPSKYLELLLPLKDSKYPDTNSLLEKIHRHAKSSLKLPNYKGEQVLSVSKSKLISVTPSENLAYKIASETSIKKDLLHSSFDRNSESIKTLSFLGCKFITDKKFVKIISNHLSKYNPDEEYIFKCLSWVADWLDEKYSNTEVFEERKSTIKSIPLFPINNQLCAIMDLKDVVISWTTTNEVKLPDWIPIRFLDAWYAENISSIEDWRSNIIELLKQLGIKQYNKSVITEGIKQGIDEFWRTKSTSPDQIFEYLLSHYQDEIYDIEKLSNCPVKVRVANSQKKRDWTPAHTAYLGKEWSYYLIEEVFKDNNQIYWVIPFEQYSIESQRNFFQDLGCVSYPRVKEKNVKNKSFYSFEDKYTDWINNGFKKEYRPKQESVDLIQELDSIDVSTLSRSASTALIELLKDNWDYYYILHSTTRYRWIPRSIEDVKGVISYWLFNLKNNLIPPLEKNYSNPKPLKDSWLPDVQTKRSVGHFIPIIDLKAFKQEQEEITEWLYNNIRVNQTLDDLEKEDWEEIICDTIPTHSTLNKLQDSSFRDKIINAYEACAESLGEKPYSKRNMKNIEILCHKGSAWSLKPFSEVFLADDSELSSAFSDVCWQLDLTRRHHNGAKKVFNLKSISEESEINIETGKESEHESKETNNIVLPILPYIYAWRCSKSSKHEEIKENITNLKIFVVDGIKATVRLADKYEKTLSKSFSVQDFKIYLNKSNSNKSVIALALADRVGVKTEADFYENLLRCNGNTVKLRNKLISKNMTEETLDRYVRDFYGDNHDSNLAEPKSGSKPTLEKNKKSKKQEASKRVISESSIDPENREKENSTFNSKDIENENIEFTSPNKSYTSSANSSSKRTNQNASKSRSSISYEDRMAIEESGRSAAEVKLKELGYDVEQMPGHNPGFDIKAIKHGVELRIEIKAHKSKVNSAELTQTEYQEYIKCQELENIKWELWNIENLSSNSHENITITRYKFLNEDAFNTRIMTINLSKCNSIESEKDL